LAKVAAKEDLISKILKY